MTGSAGKARAAQGAAVTRARRGCRGTAFIEFLLAFPVFLMVLFAAADYGIAVSDRTALQRAILATGRKTEVYEFQACTDLKTESEKIFEKEYGKKIDRLRVDAYYDAGTGHDFIELSLKAQPLSCIFCLFGPLRYSAGFTFARDKEVPCGCGDYAGLC